MKTVLRNLLRLLSVAVFGATVIGVLAAGGYINWSSDSPDAVSSATAQPVSAGDMKGKYVVILNKALHDRTGTTEDWTKFFSFAEDVPLIMEDITCKVAQFDSDRIDTGA